MKCKYKLIPAFLYDQFNRDESHEEQYEKVKFLLRPLSRKFIEIHLKAFLVWFFIEIILNE
jgi:hypothetical protein